MDRITGEVLALVTEGAEDGACLKDLIGEMGLGVMFGVEINKLRAVGHNIESFTCSGMCGYSSKHIAFRIAS